VRERQRRRARRESRQAPAGEREVRRGDATEAQNLARKLPPRKGRGAARRVEGEVCVARPHRRADGKEHRVARAGAPRPARARDRARRWGTSRARGRRGEGDVEVEVLDAHPVADLNLRTMAVDVSAIGPRAGAAARRCGGGRGARLHEVGAIDEFDLGLREGPRRGREARKVHPRARAARPRWFRWMDDATRAHDACTTLHADTTNTRPNTRTHARTHARTQHTRLNTRARLGKSVRPARGRDVQLEREAAEEHVDAAERARPEVVLPRARVRTR